MLYFYFFKTDNILNLKLQNFIFSILFLHSSVFFAQDVTLLNQFNGNYDFTFIGNTMNIIENNNIEGELPPPCTILTSSSSLLNLSNGNTIIKAYLYWAGVGAGDFDVTLNTQNISADRTFEIINPSGLPCFSAFSDITQLIQNTGNGNYTLADLDLTDLISDYCENGSNFAGWAILIIYENVNLPINQINIYDGLEAIPNVINISLDNLNVVDNIDAKIGFIAWEGDKNIKINESLRINGNLISNPPLNPDNNAFNGTNSITGSDTLYNMDLDVYDIQNNIQIGDSSALIQLTSNQDFVMINTIVTKLNNQSPDATITIDNINGYGCDLRTLTINYTTSNFNGIEDLPAGIPIAIYANDILIGQTQTNNIIAIGASESGQITLTIPNSIPFDFDLRFKVDDLGNNIGIQAELIESNNNTTTHISLLYSPFYNNLSNLFSCVSSLTNVSFNFSNYATSVLVNPTDTVQFFTSITDANANSNPILDITNFITNTATTTIYVRLDNANCYSITTFDVNQIVFPSFNNLDDLFTCKVDPSSSFNFSNYSDLVKANPGDLIQFFGNSEDAVANVNPILNTSNYIPNQTPKEIFVSIFNGFCYSYTSFKLDYYELPKFNLVPNMTSCNEGLTKGTFNFLHYDDLVKVNSNDTITFYENLEDAEQKTNPVITPSNYKATSTPKEIYIRIENENCFDITSFILNTKNCPPIIYNYISANNDYDNPTFFIEGLRDVFIDFKIEIYNRWGQLVWVGDNSTPDWDGLSNQEVRLDNSILSPRGTYYYIVYLNDVDYPEPIIGYLYLHKAK